MGWRNDQCRKVCRIIDIFLANRPTERDSLIVAVRKAFNALEQAETNCSEIPNNSDTISRQAVTKFLNDWLSCLFENCHKQSASDLKMIIKDFKNLPSEQSERTCVNCGRTANNGGWYADGRTRCPIEEHYALPKDGYCHLWEKRNVTDDDYPERRTDE